MTTTDQPFPFERLDVYGVILEYAALVDPIVDALPKGEAETRSQLKRASLSILNNLCEGAGRWGNAEKANFYSIARGSALECAGALAWIRARRIAATADTEEALNLLRRIGAMLTKLVMRHRRE